MTPSPTPFESEGNREIGENDVGDLLSKDKVLNEGSSDLYTKLITEAPYIRGDDSELVPLDEIPWVDKSLIEHSIRFHRKYLTFTLLSNTFALMFGFAIKPNSAVLLRTGKLHDPELSFQRYLSTIQRIGKFFMLPIDPEKAYKSFATVRKMHILASKKRAKSDNRPLQNPESDNLKLREPWKTELAQAMRKDLDHIDTSSAPKHLLTWDPPVPVSQFDMAITQLGFFGTMWLYPKVFGIRDRFEEMKGVIHVWAIFGRLLGIRDEFNICLHPDPALFDKLHTNIVIHSLKYMDETVITIQKAFADAFCKRVPFMTYKAMLLIGLRELEGYKGEELWKLMSWGDRLSFFTIRIWVWSIRTSFLYRMVTHILTGLWVQFQFWMHLSTSLWD